MKQRIWENLTKKPPKDLPEVLNILLKNRQADNTFFNPPLPENLKLKDLKISETEVKRGIERIKLAKKKNEKVIIYGDYDADGITATAILWEALYKNKFDIMPYIPNRFEEGYGINAQSVSKLKKENPSLKLIITVDNGIVAVKDIEKIKKLGIDVIITDHHTIEKTKPKAFAIIHTTQICGSALAWIFAREILKRSKITNYKSQINDSLELSAIGTIADQMPLIGANRSFAKFGLEKLNKTKRIGLREMLKDVAIKEKSLGTYEINYIIAPRINSMGRLKHGLDSLRLICTKDPKRARELSQLINETNAQRQDIVEKTVLDVKQKAGKLREKIIFLASPSYHEGIIGLAAGRIVEEFYKPAIVVSVGKKLSKGSARSISGFNIIEAIREHSDILIAHGGHVMAAGFTIETAKIKKFQKEIIKTSKLLLTLEVLSRRLKIDCKLELNSIDWQLAGKLKSFEPTGIGNPTPTFVTQTVEVVEARLLGSLKNHLKLKIRKDNKFFDAIGFGMGELFDGIKKGSLIDIVYSIEENIWNGTKSIQLKLKDLRLI